MAVIGEVTGNEEYGRLADIIPAGEAIADEFIAIASGAGLMQGLKAGSAAVAAAGVTPRGRERLARRIEYMRDVEAASTDPAVAERVRQANSPRAALRVRKSMPPWSRSEARGLSAPRVRG